MKELQTSGRELQAGGPAPAGTRPLPPLPNVGGGRTSKGGPGEKAPPAPPRPRVLTGLSCASCGGTVEVEEGCTNLVCRYCGTPLAVVGDRGVRHLMVLDTVDRERAARAVHDWFRKGIRKAPALKREAHYQEAFLAWFPFVRARLDVVGWVLGYRKRRRKRGNQWVTVREPVERQVEEAVDRTLPSADMAEFGVSHVNLAGDEVLALDEERLRKRGMVFRPQLAPAELGDKLERSALTEIEASSRLDHVDFSWLAAVRRRISVVFYPLWVIRFSFRGQTYQALIDAQDGSLAYGKAPGNHLWRAFCLVAAAAGTCFVGTTVLQHARLFLRDHNGLAGLGVIGLVLVGFMTWGYRQFRRGGVVEEGSGRPAEADADSLGATVKRMMEDFE